MEEQKLTYNIIDYTEYPGPRYRQQGVDSGEAFYEDKLKGLFEEVLRKSEISKTKITLEVNLDNTAGYASSFLDEAFGNLSYDFGADIVKAHLRIVSEQEPDWVDVIMDETIPEWQEKKNLGTPRKPKFANE
ncbi:MAG: STAS-like domain-containing protein [Marinoscillum sp.]